MLAIVGRWCYRSLLIWDELAGRRLAMFARLIVLVVKILRINDVDDI